MLLVAGIHTECFLLLRGDYLSGYMERVLLSPDIFGQLIALFVWIKSLGVLSSTDAWGKVRGHKR